MNIRRQGKQSWGPLRVWYRLTSPTEPDDSAPFEKRDLFRRGRTGSQIVIFLFILTGISFPAAFAGSNSLLVNILIGDLVVLTLAMVFNRLGQVSVAGVLVVICVTTSPTANILTTPGGISTAALPVFCILILSLLCAVSFLPPAWVFLVALGNCVFTIYVLLVLPTTGELHNLLITSLPGIVTPIIISQVLVSIVAYLWVRGAKEALRRADRAEVIAEYKEATSQELSQFLNELVEVFVAQANGELRLLRQRPSNDAFHQATLLLNERIRRFAQLKKQQEGWEISGVSQGVRNLSQILLGIMQGRVPMLTLADFRSRSEAVNALAQQIYQMLKPLYMPLFTTESSTPAPTSPTPIPSMPLYPGQRTPTSHMRETGSIGGH